jgi:hypothetical protein
MVLSASQASGILGITEDELLFLHQTNKLEATVNQESLIWEFNLEDILKIKAQDDDCD